MKNLSLSQKSLLIFLILTSVIFVVAVTVYVGFNKFKSDSENLDIVKDLKNQIIVLTSIRHDVQRLDQGVFRKEVSKARALTREITLFKQSFQEDPDLFRRVNSLILSLGYFQDSWLELADKYEQNREFAKRALEIPEHLAMNLPMGVQMIIHTELEKLLIKLSEFHQTNDVSFIGDMVSIRDKIFKQTDDPVVLSTLNRIVGIAESSYLNALSIKEREQFLLDTTKNMIQSMDDTIQFIDQSREDSNVVLNWVINSILAISVFLTFGLWIVVTRYLNSFLMNQNMAIKEISDGNYDYPLPETSGDELGELSRVMKNLAITVKTSEEFFANTLNELPLYIFVLELDGTINFANKQVLKSIGIEMDALKGTKLQHSFWVDHAVGEAESMDELIKACASGERQFIQMQWRIAGGAIIWVDFSLNPIFDDDAWVKYLIPVAVDISERKKSEGELEKHRMHLEELVEMQTKELKVALKKAKESQKVAEAANYSKDHFLANMSHEIRTPMNAVIGMSHLALQTKLEPKQRNYIEKVHHSAEGLLGILNDILDFSKIESGKLDMEVTDFRLEDVIDNLTNLIALKADENGVALNFNIPTELPTALIGDPLRLGQILINLGNNAAKFTEPGDQITVTAKVEKEDDDEVMLFFSISDTGIGMSKEQQQRLFQSFSQADSSTTRKYGGTGLGLAISKELVEMMGGKIWAESEEGVGSTFHFSVCLKKQHGEPSARSSEAPELQNYMVNRLHGAKVLLVEDHPINQELALELLVNNGLSVVVANNGEEALTLLAEQEFDGVLMDCQMPVMDGYTASRKIREQEKLKDLPVIAMTANAMAGDLDKALAAGMNDHIAKPINVNGMFSTMAKWITPSQPVAAANILKPQQPTTDSDELPVLPGIDTKVGLTVALGKVAIYRRLLISFRDHYDDFATKFYSAQAESDDDPDAATRAAHSLKGLAATIGAVGVQKAAELLEVACRDGLDNIDELVDHVMAALDPVITGLEALQEPTPIKPTSSTVNKEAVEPLFCELYKLANDSSINAIDVVERLAPLIGGTQYSEELDKIASAIRSYDFELTIEALTTLADDLKINYR